MLTSTHPTRNQDAMEPELQILPALIFLLLHQEHERRRRRPSGVLGSGAAGGGVLGSGAAGGGVLGSGAGSSGVLGSGEGGGGVLGSGAAGGCVLGSGATGGIVLGSGAGGSGVLGSGAAGGGVLGSLKLGQYRCQRLLGMVVGSHDVGEGLVESGFPGPVLPLAVVCTAIGILRLKDRSVDSWVVIVWTYSCWRDGVGFVIASSSLTFSVSVLCGCLDFGRVRAVGHNDRGRIPLWCVGGLLHGGKRLLPPML
ncbi:hypothetical protein NDU88_005251 [Pleurodeles waltl]|uniref:Uncharacterized protein n=1 Tax=Pleurodeles waltl TaxID=8319 RepID=A0AAV7PN42_PLEWA|nr:hypothetical protein NDU88_005251 [Pleurodeles waltl]